ncbi:hypothetical protein [Thauera humireducens]|uniref:hypothetical protein n=1 Tax=Thauera humireducens TaxID=1134435 RepID=UPI00311F0010
MYANGNMAGHETLRRKFRPGVVVLQMQPDLPGTEGALGAVLGVVLALALVLALGPAAAAMLLSLGCRGTGTRTAGRSWSFGQRCVVLACAAVLGFSWAAVRADSGAWRMRCGATWKAAM